MIETIEIECLIRGVKLDIIEIEGSMEYPIDPSEFVQLIDNDTIK
jgi:hypothetical protein